MSQRSRSILKMIFTSFANSFKPRQIRGNLVGTDYFGTKYYEISANPSVGKRKPSRWFEPLNKDDFDQELPAEWEAWLRGRRIKPPTVDEILKNVSIMQIKKKNAAEFEQIYKNPKQTVTGIKSFPQYDEYESIPGKSKETKG